MSSAIRHARVPRDGSGAPLIDSRSPAAAAGRRVRREEQGGSSIADRAARTGSARHGRRRCRRIGLRRLLGWAVFLPLASRAPIYARLFWALVRDDRTPIGRKAMLARRARLPRDRAGPRPGRRAADRRPRRPGRRRARRGPVPRRGARRPCSTRSSTTWGSTAAAFDADVARIRRFTPGPLRRIIRRVPGAGRRSSGDTLAAQRARASGPGLDQQGGFDRVKVILTKDVAEARQDGRDEDGRRRLRPELPHPAEARRARFRRRLSRVPARHREPRGQAQARARRRRDRRDPHRAARP